MQGQDVPLEAIQALDAEIRTAQQQLKDLKKLIANKADGLLKSLVPAVQDWKPNYNEKAVCIQPSHQVAWHVWFTEEINPGYLRFKEEPNEYKFINNYYRQNLNDLSETWDYLIIPLELFYHLNQDLKWELYKDKHLKLL